MGPFGTATLLGMLHGLTEYLPVSSSGHLALTTLVLGIDAGGPTLTVMLQAGTLLAATLVLWGRIVPALREGALGLVQPRRFVATNGGRDALVLLVAALPATLVGLSLGPHVSWFARSPTALGIGFCVTTLLLLSTRWAAAGEAPVPTAWGSLAMGLVQGLAVMPGVSRTGATLVVALWLGVRKDRAFELSVMVSLPVALTQALSKVPELAVDADKWTAGFVGAAVAFALGVAALVAVRRSVMQGTLSWFALWVGPLALATLAMAKAWPVR